MEHMEHPEMHDDKENMQSHMPPGDMSMNMNGNTEEIEPENSTNSSDMDNVSMVLTNHEIDKHKQLEIHCKGNCHVKMYYPSAEDSADKDDRDEDENSSSAEEDRDSEADSETNKDSVTSEDKSKDESNDDSKDDSKDESDEDHNTLEEFAAETGSTEDSDNNSDAKDGSIDNKDGSKDESEAESDPDSKDDTKAEDSDESVMKESEILMILTKMIWGEMTGGQADRSTRTHNPGGPHKTHHRTR
ncbi:hypothetical protein DPEC_G00286820 [Dallia pectoralis]|uniref:Uncharacterized protein n=1 Tax=Dallia pectoralis TaxID=75939 RepID=A0ACC2FK33_DALPE|nr:hypothetical protein DPEC_G00286820 [Dallia pectoralis]